MGEDEKREWKEVIRQEQFWFTATTATLIGVLAGLLKNPNWFTGVIALVMIVLLAGFTIYLLVNRFNRYNELDNKAVKGWWPALGKAITERSGTLYCVGVVFNAAVGFGIIVVNSTLASSTKDVIEIKPGTRIIVQQ